MIVCPKGFIFISVDLSYIEKLFSTIVINKRCSRTPILNSAISKCLEEDLSGQNVISVHEFKDKNF